ncbi:cbb3-type cytochrome oxidase assembly protein CcoS [Marinibaculum pumilum]|uniref:Cbb3-type cytochrome oxidase assembly protein CcoS n=1 Tax=Marinibaculum pumilum TaxID=1766165 RepID=A0ABV7KX06_9PROT
MTNLVILIPAALLLGGIGLAAFLWCLNSGQFDDLDGAAQRVLLDDPAEERHATQQQAPGQMEGRDRPSPDGDRRRSDA